MFTFPLLAALVTSTSIHLASALDFLSGSDYDVYKTRNLYNCTGRNPVSNLTALNAFDTLPQIDTSAGYGWEQWTLSYLTQNQRFPIILIWTQGNPSAPEPSLAHLDVILDVNGTVVHITVPGNLSYTENDQVKQISIENNTLTWDSDALWYNVSVSINDYHLELDSYSATQNAFHPNVAFHNGLLDQSGSWFGSVPLVRGHAVGTIATPATNAPYPHSEGISVMRHMFSENPLPSYIKKYAGGTFWGSSTNFSDSHVFYQTETTNGTVHNAGFLSRGIPTPGANDTFSPAWATYAVTDSDVYTLNVAAPKNEINASFSGCANVNNIPYLFNATLTLINEIPDLGGGITSYYTVSGTTSAPLNGVVTSSSIIGFFEEYKAPSLPHS